MKTLKFALVVPLLAFAVSCTKNTASTATVTADEAADIAAGSLSVNSFGITILADNVGANAQTLSTGSAGGQAVNSTGATAVKQACGTTLTDSLTSSGSTSSVTYSAFYKYARTLTCNTNNQPDNLVNAITFRGNFDGPRLTSTDVGTANVKIAGLTTAATNFLINGTYNRRGTFTSKVGAKASGTSNVDITVTNLLLSKPARNIVSGTATITISGTAPAGAFSYSGNLVFTGNNTATLTVGTVVYTINLLTGTYVK